MNLKIVKEYNKKIMPCDCKCKLRKCEEVVVPLTFDFDANVQLSGTGSVEDPFVYTNLGRPANEIDPTFGTETRPAATIALWNITTRRISKLDDFYSTCANLVFRRVGSHVKMTLGGLSQREGANLNDPNDPGPPGTPVVNRIVDNLSRQSNLLWTDTPGGYLGTDRFNFNENRTGPTGSNVPDAQIVFLIQNTKAEHMMDDTSRGVFNYRYRMNGSFDPTGQDPFGVFGVVFTPPDTETQEPFRENNIGGGRAQNYRRIPAGIFIDGAPPGGNNNILLKKAVVFTRANNVNQDIWNEDKFKWRYIQILSPENVQWSIEF